MLYCTNVPFFFSGGFVLPPLFSADPRDQEDAGPFRIPHRPVKIAVHLQAGLPSVPGTIAYSVPCVCICVPMMEGHPLWSWRVFAFSTCTRMCESPLVLLSIASRILSKANPFKFSLGACGCDHEFWNIYSQTSGFSISSTHAVCSSPVVRLRLPLLFCTACSAIRASLSLSLFI